MIIQMCDESKAGFIHLFTNVIGGFTYSINNMDNTMSLDEVVTGIYTATGKIPASKIIEIIGDTAFKSMVENIAKSNVEVAGRGVSRSWRLDILMYYYFSCNYTLEGCEYWMDIYHKLASNKGYLYETNY